MLDGILFAHEHIRRIIALQEKLRELVQPSKRIVAPFEIDPAVRERVVARAAQDLPGLLSHPVKKERDLQISEYSDKLVSEMDDLDENGQVQAKEAFHEYKEQTIRRWILEQRQRPDGRAFDQVRPVSCELGVLPRTHGSALFTRGETQALVTATLGTSSDTQKIEALEGEHERRFLLHYNFPPFSVGEVKFLRGPGRREIGHGALASRALEPVIPDEDAFPYTIRIVSDIVESNGSSSMASVCGGSLALMDAGVPVKAPVAGVAMGLVMQGDKYAILTDIAGFEDHYGDMDFKVTGTTEGITALQMDIKIEGITPEIMREALEQARRGRLHILDIMSQTIAKARPEISVYAPRILTIQIPKEKIRDVIGPGGKVVRSIVERTGAKIDIKDDGSVDIASIDEAAAKMAREIIEEIIAEAEVGKTYLGRVQRLTDFGAFVEILPGTDGLLHISEVSEHHIREVTDVLEEGQELLVKVISIDPQGRVRLSRKAVLQEQGIVEEPPPHSGERPPRREDRPRRDDRRGPRGSGGRGPRRDGRRR
jgi:polyribonucleotide nucleotidyltransferase